MERVLRDLERGRDAPEACEYQSCRKCSRLPIHSSNCSKLYDLISRGATATLAMKRLFIFDLSSVILLTKQRMSYDMDKSQQEVFKQTTVTLPFLDDQVPALSMANGRLYIPVCAVC